MATAQCKGPVPPKNCLQDPEDSFELPQHMCFLPESYSLTVISTDSSLPVFKPDGNGIMR